MAYDIIPFLLIIISFFVIVFIVGKKVPSLRVLDVDTIKEVKESRMKKKILEDRMKRGLKSLGRRIVLLLKPVFEKLFSSMRTSYRKIMDMEKRYKSEVAKKREEKINPYERIRRFAAEAREFAKDGKFEEAEERYIKIIEIDDKNVDAYDGLGELYMEQKEYEKARDTFKYLLKLYLEYYQDEEDGEAVKHELASCYANISESKERLEDYDKALENVQKAVELEPNNPRFLDLLLKISIIKKDKKLAHDTLKKLKEADPENKKLDELETEVRNISSSSLP